MLCDQRFKDLCEACGTARPPGQRNNHGPHGARGRGPAGAAPNALSDFPPWQTQLVIFLPLKLSSISGMSQIPCHGVCPLRTVLHLSWLVHEHLSWGHAGRGGRLGGGTGRGRGQGRGVGARGDAGVNGRGGQPNRGHRRRRESDDDDEEQSRGRGRGRTAPR